MKRYSVLLLIFIAMAMQSITYANQSNNKNEVIDNQTYVKGQKEMSLKFSEVPPEIEMKLKDVILAGNDGGNEYFVVIPANDASAATGELGIYICSGNNLNTRVIVERCDEGVVVNTTIPEKFQLLWLTQLGTPVQGGVSVTLSGISESEILNKNQYPESHDEDYIFPNKGYRIYTEPDPITGIAPDIYVYSASFRSATADGYMALPTSGIGNKYVHCSLTDNDESYNQQENNTSSNKWRTGFTAIATQDNTIINYRLSSVNFRNICISFNKKPANGSTYSSPLMKTCDTWTLTNGINSVQNQVCDFSGTIVESSKNFGFISWSQRTNLPVGRDYSRDNLCEQLLPVDKWGNKYITIQMKGNYEETSKWRTYNGGKDPWSNKNPGNYFRLVGKEPGTNVTVKWYSLEDYVMVGTEKFFLDSLGDMQEYLAIPGEFTAASMPQYSVAGAAVWESNKPFQLMQYQTTCGLYWYSHGIFDPGMVIVPPIAQYGTNTTFVSGCNEGNASFAEHYVTLIAEGPKNSDGTPNTEVAARDSVLNTIIMYTNGKNAKTISFFDYQFTGQKVPTENYYFARYKLDPNCVYRIEGRTKMSAIVYGWGSAISYIWPASMKLVSTVGVDTLPPVVGWDRKCGEKTTSSMLGYVEFNAYWIDTVWEAEKPYDDNQYDKGLVKPPFITHDETSNLAHYRYFYDRPSAAPSTSWRTGQPWFEGSVQYRTIDPYQDVFAILLFEDEAGNESLCTLTYIADKLEFFDNKGATKYSIDFGEVVMGGTYFDTTIVKNINTEPTITYIEELFLTGSPSNGFKLEEIIKDDEKIDLVFSASAEYIELKSQEEIMVIVSFTPAKAALVTDKIMINTQCLYWDFDISGSSGFPRITVTDWDFGDVFVGRKSNASGRVTITNNGNMPLTITGYHFEQTIVSGEECKFQVGPFWYEPVYGNDNFPITIQPGIPYTIQNLWTIPFIQNGDSVRMYFDNDAIQQYDVAEYKDYALLEVNGKETGAAITPHNWMRKRVNTYNEATIEISNIDGNTDITTREINNPTWNRRNDTLWSPGDHYFIPDVSQYEGRTIKPIDSDYPANEKVVVIDVRFHPKSEYPHLENDVNVGNCQLVDSFYVNFTSESDIDNNTTISRLRGEAWLPKIEATGYTWETNTEVDSLSDEMGVVTIHNTSYTSGLLIKEINLLPGDQSQDFELLGNYNNATILRSSDDAIGELLIPVAFHPSSTSPQVRRARVEIISDAMHGEGKPGDPDPNPTRKDTVWLIAETYDVGLEIGAINYGDITRCDAPTGQLGIYNLSTTNTLEVHEIEIDPAYAYLFEQMDYLTYPIIVNSNSNGSANIQVTYKFDACKWVDPSTGARMQENLEVNVTVKSNMGTLTTTFKAVPMIIPVKLRLPNIGDTEPDTEIPIRITIEISPDNKNFYNFNNAKITSFTIKLQTERKALFFENNKYDQAQSGWTFTVSQTSDGLVTITGSGNGNLEAGICAIPRAKLLASSLTDIPMQIVDFSVNDRECCIDWTEEPGSVKSTFCAQEARGGLIISGTQYSLPPVTPNPYMSNTLELNYNIGLDGDAVLEIYNSNGELVKSVLNGYAKIGKHTANVDVSNLASGAYTIVLKAGQFEETQKLIIIK